MKLKKILCSILAGIIIISNMPAVVFASTNAKTTSSANLRSRPGVVFSLLKTLSAGTQVTVIGKEMSWYKVRVGNVEGYVIESLIKVTDPAVEEKYNPVKYNYEKLASYETWFSSSDKNRNHNIELSAYKNNIILKPGATFSFNKNTGNSASTANGWRESIVIVNKKRVPGIGGGICQTSSTIHSAVLRVKGLKVTERRPHSLPVGYVPVSHEAMVSYGSSDLKFRNDNSYDVFIYSSVNQIAGKITTTIYKINPNAVKPTTPVVPVEPPKPKDTPEDIKKAYVKQFNSFFSNPNQLLDLLKVDKTNLVSQYYDLSFTMDDIDKDGKTDLLINVTVFATRNIDGKNTFTQDVYYMIYSYTDDKLNFITSNPSVINGSVIYKIEPYREKSTGKVNWFAIDYSTGEYLVYKFEKGFKKANPIGLADFEAMFTKIAVNSTKATYESIKEFSESKLLIPEIVPKVVVNGTAINYNVKPQMINDRIYIEMRSLFESLGYTVDYNASTKAIAVHGNNEQFFIDNGVSSTVVVHTKDGITTQIPIEIPLKIVSDRTMFPLRFAGELLDYEVSWQQSEYTASLNSKKIEYDIQSEEPMQDLYIEQLPDIPEDTPEDISEETPFVENEEVQDTNQTNEGADTEIEDIREFDFDGEVLEM